MDRNLLNELKNLQDRFDELTVEMTQPQVIQQFDRYQKVVRERMNLIPVIDTLSSYREKERQLKDARELLRDPEFAEEARTEADCLSRELEELEEQLRLLLLPADPMDQRNVVLEIRAGVGGEEAALFAADLLRMYLKYSDRNSLKYSVLSLNETELGGISEAVTLITGANAYSRLKYESGVHCVKRIPVTESGGRIHTSTATVAVLPEADEVEIQIDPGDVRVDVFRSSGHGGQGVNTTDSAVRITHLPTGTVVTCQDERSQMENKAKAMRVLRSRLLDRMQQEAARNYTAHRKEQIGTGDRSERIRTYYFNHDYVVDHRIGLTVNRTANIMNGDLSPFLEGLDKADKALRLKRLSGTCGDP